MKTISGSWRYACLAIALTTVLTAQQIDYNQQIKNKPAINTTAPLSGGATLNPSATIKLTPCAAFQFYRTNAGATGWQCVGVMPLASDNIQYVSPNGNDLNDGLSWGSAKLTAAGALSAIGANSGMIYESPGTGIDGIAGTGSATGLNGWLWAPQRFYIGPLSQATSANTGVDSRRLHLVGSVWNGSAASDDFWQVYVNSFPGSFTNGSNLIVQHSSVENGAGRVLALSDLVIGPPGAATSTHNFNSFAFDNQGGYWNGSAQNMLWEMANTVTPTSGFPVTFRQNFVPIFSDSCAGCSAEVAFGGSGSLGAAGNYPGTPKWLWPNLNGSFFTASFNHSLTANRSFTYPDAGGILPTLAGNSGQLQFNGATNLAADNNLFWDNTNKFLGIGPATPDVILVVSSSASAGAMQFGINNRAAGGSEWYLGSTDNGNGSGGGLFLINNSNNTNSPAFAINSSKQVAIGTKTPSALFQVNSSVAGGANQVELSNAATGGANWWLGSTDNGNGIGGGKFVIHHANSTAGSQFTIDSATNNVGIGQTSPAFALDTTGIVNATAGFKSGNSTFSSLAPCGGSTEGRIAAVTDSTTNTWGATITGGGANHVLAYCDGTNWTVAGK